MAELRPNAWLFEDSATESSAAGFFKWYKEPVTAVGVVLLLTRVCPKGELSSVYAALLSLRGTNITQLQEEVCPWNG